MKTYSIHSPFAEKDLIKLRVGDQIVLNGYLYTARDQAHARLFQTLNAGKKIPIEISNQAIYYCGPTQTPSQAVIGSCGPTTSRRMDRFTPRLIEEGLKVMIGKGSRNQEVIEAIKKHKALYCVTHAGCGALLTQFVKSAQVVAYPDLGPESILKLEVRNFPLIVAIDAYGRSLYAQV